jgi:hypothetical protein
MKRIRTPDGTYAVSSEDARAVLAARRRYGVELLVGRSGEEIVGEVYGREVVRVKILTARGGRR